MSHDVSQESGVTLFFDSYNTSYFSFVFIAEALSTLVSVIQLFFFLQKYNQKKCEWELIFVALCEALTGALHLMYSHTFSSFMYVTLSDGTPINLLRYVEWLATCPIIARHLWGLCAMNPKSGVNLTDLTIIMILVQTMIAAGAWAAFAGLEHHYMSLSLGIGYWTACTVSWILWCALYWRMWVIFEKGQAVEKDPKVKAALFNIQALYFTTWIFFPMFFMLGPESYGIVDMLFNNALHASGDLLAKNYMGHLCWKFHWEVCAHSHAQGHEVDMDHDIYSKQIQQQEIPLFQNQNENADKFIMVDNNPVAYNIFQNIIGYDFNGYVDPVESSDQLFELIRLSNGNITILISYELVQENLDILLQSIGYATSGKVCSILVYGSNLDMSHEVPAKYRDSLELKIIDNIFNQDSVRSALAKAYAIKNKEFTDASFMIQNLVNNPQLDEEMLMRLIRIKDKMSELINSEKSKATNDEKKEAFSLRLETSLQSPRMSNPMLNSNLKPKMM